MTDPIFPREIENTIFICALALKAKDESALNLILVARRFHAWLMPELLRTLVVQSISRKNKHPFRWNISTIERYGIHTRNLFFWTSSQGQIQDFSPYRVLELCPNVTNLLLWTDKKDSPIEHLGRLPLTHLSFELNDISEMTPELGQLFSKITHFEALGSFTSEHDLEQLREFTSITHLAIPDTSRLDLLPMLFANHPTLEVLIFLDGHGSRDEVLSVDAAFDPGMDDLRIVKMTCQHERQVEEWLLDVEMGLGIWGMADDAVQERKTSRDAVQRR
ncbi:hypothetical protein BDN72DRAFT_846117 [Pluteus cervinus]|uniref:Uncharacterized protein n=1 Tax=Pluteus cervinus TaxID=181527 RepID=A0ACD3AH05_9AGAR|nr:hypothetical protein BDN72DRAFT_846117 [Pluteus cervinus]